MGNIYSNIYSFNNKMLKKTVNSLKRGNIAGLPTETVYGLAGNAYSKSAVKKIFKLKKRPKKNPLIVHYYDSKFIHGDILVNQYFRRLYRKFCPGPITFILRKKKNSKIGSLVTANLSTIAIRFPKHKIARAVLKSLKENYDILIFDDGLQDSKIDYNVTLVCFKTKIWIGNGQLIPAGPLREKISSLKKYDAVILNGKSKNLENIKNQILKINSNIKIICTYYKIKNIEEFNLGSKYLIFSGVGSPEDFKNTLIENKFKIEDEVIYSDHYEYKSEDFESILIKAEDKDLKIITTEKDYMKIPDKFRNKIKFINIETVIENEEELLNLVNN